MTNSPFPGAVADAADSRPDLIDLIHEVNRTAREDARAAMTSHRTDFDPEATRGERNLAARHAEDARVVANRAREAAFRAAYDVMGRAR